MIQKNKGTGAGGAITNLNGIRFEENVYLKDWLIKEDFVLVDNNSSTKRSELFKIQSGNKVVGYYGRQGQIYTALKEIFTDMNNNFIKEVLSKKINPDAFIITTNIKDGHKLFIFEKKWQQTSGSVDEKIQTAPFKLEMFSKLLRNKINHIEYHYILSKWFKNRSYKNVKDYYLEKFSNKIFVWVEDENLNDLSLKNLLKH